MKLEKITVLAIILSIIYLSGILYLYVSPFTYAKISYKPIETQLGLISATAYSPTTNSRSDVVVIMIHGWSASRTYMNALALDIVRAGFRVLSIDQIGHQGSYNPMFLDASIKDIREMAINSIEDELKIAGSVIETARELVNNKSARIILVGHSLGGALSIMIGSHYSDDVDAVFALGPLPPYEYVNATNPKGLIVILGENDQVFNVSEEVKLLKLAGWSNPEPGKNASIDGAVRAFYVLSGVDHIWEPYSSETSKIILSWLNEFYGCSIAGPNVEALALFSIVVLPILGIALAPVLLIEVLRRLNISLPSWRECYYKRVDNIRFLLALSLSVGVGVYILVGIPLGFTFAPFLPQTPYRILRLIIFLVLLYPLSLLWEFIFRVLIPKILKKYGLGDYSVVISPVTSIIVKYILLVAVLSFFISWLSSLGYTYLSIVYGIQGFMSVVGVLIIILLEIPPALTYSFSARFEFSSLAASVFLAIFIASAAPVLIFLNPPVPVVFF